MKRKVLPFHNEANVEYLYFFNINVRQKIFCSETNKKMTNLQIRSTFSDRKVNIC